MYILLTGRSTCTLAVNRVDLGAAAQEPPQHAEFAGMDRDYDPVKEEDRKETEQEQEQDDVRRVAPDESF
jgi:hypothetical protein